jgi:hypothetical protein
MIVGRGVVIVDAETTPVVGHVEVSGDLPRSVADPCSNELDYLPITVSRIATYMKPPILATRPRKTATKVTF